MCSINYKSFSIFYLFHCIISKMFWMDVAKFQKKEIPEECWDKYIFHYTFPVIFWSGTSFTILHFINKFEYNTIFKKGIMKTPVCSLRHKK